jgi:chlorite dismutase
VSEAQAPQGEGRPGLPVIDVLEYGAKKDGVRQQSNRRMFFQLLVFDLPLGRDPDGIAESLVGQLRERKIPGVVYADVNDPRGVGLLTWGEDPARFVTEVRPLFHGDLLRDAQIRDGWQMLGRTYSGGHEQDLEHWLLRRPVENVLNGEYPWHVWYPLRRTGAFMGLDTHEQNMILREHAAIGMAYGAQELGHDVRLACHGMDAKDNEFVIGLVGRELFALSHLVQTMRKTRQTREFIAQMGPFFVGRVVGRSSG